MGTEWYYAKDQVQYGPIELEELKALAVSGQLHSTDMVWTTCMADWRPAEQVAELWPIKPSLSPPPLPRMSDPPPISSPAVVIKGSSTSEIKVIGDNRPVPPPFTRTANVPPPHTQATIPPPAPPPMPSPAPPIKPSNATASPANPNAGNFVPTKNGWFIPLGIGVLLFGVMVVCCGGLSVLGWKMHRLPRTQSPDASESSSSNVEDEERGKSKPTASAHHGAREFSVSKGWGNRLTIELDQDIADEITVSDFRWNSTMQRLEFKLTLNPGDSGPSVDPWHYSAFNTEGVKLRGTIVDFPSIRTGETVKASVYLGNDFKAITRVQIHR